MPLTLQNQQGQHEEVAAGGEAGGEAREEGACEEEAREEGACEEGAREEEPWREVRAARRAAVLWSRTAMRTVVSCRRTTR
jgi:hypothetical protein